MTPGCWRLFICFEALCLLKESPSISTRREKKNQVWRYSSSSLSTSASPSAVGSGKRCLPQILLSVCPPGISHRPESAPGCCRAVPDPMSGRWSDWPGTLCSASWRNTNVVRCKWGEDKTSCPLGTHSQSPAWPGWVWTPHGESICCPPSSFCSITQQASER